MVKIRYSELPAGLHVSVEKRGRTTLVYLLPGLTTEQRRAAIIRARSSGRMGLGPELPPVSLGLAIGFDRVRTTLRNGLQAMLAHPVLLLPPLILVVSSAIVFMVTSLVTVTMHASQAAPSPSPSQGVYHGRTVPHDRPAGSLPGRRLDPAAYPTPTQSSYGPARSVPLPASTPSPAYSSPVPVLSSSPPASPSPSPWPSPSPPPSSGPSPAASCAKPGPLGLCVPQ
ncbi:MAG TPA: hypothetical protein VEL03_13195 [Streptosporangiaceae bacterium]|nr:hypothetical protein [Streptosporangiaceae bacterium]